MRLKNLDLNLVIVLDALLRERSVSIAAVSLNLGQSAVSSALARLREHYRDELLTPVNRQMVPTALALELQGAVTEWLQGVDSIVNTQTEFNPQQTPREFVVLCSDYISATFIPGLITRLAEQAPNASLAIRPLNTYPLASSPTENIARRGAHFSILPSEYCSPTHGSSELFHERFCCVAWSGNPLVHDHLSLQLLHDLQHVAVQFSDDTPDALDARTLAMSGISRMSRVVVDQFMLAAELVTGTSYITMVPLRLGRLMAESLPLRVFELPPGTGKFEFIEALQWNQGQLDDPALRWFRDLVIETAAGH